MTLSPSTYPISMGLTQPDAFFDPLESQTFATKNLCIWHQFTKNIVLLLGFNLGSDPAWSNRSQI